HGRAGGSTLFPYTTLFRSPVGRTTLFLSAGRGYGRASIGGQESAVRPSGWVAAAECAHIIGCRAEANGARCAPLRFPRNPPMRDYSWLHEYCLNRFGSAQALEARLPVPASAEALRAMPDDRYLSQISRRVFRAGLKHSLVDARWPAFEEAFFGFAPEKAVLMGGEHLERLMGDTRLIRHLAKLSSVPRNAQ